ncbi:MAG TPA: GWxTD domain-containing protein [Thermoanaerobaculia bacterium]|jgi:GWxTD domain-containing protein|nr:GWxTD domain-containing protein [Thermoanaerobaculia bacterium]
MKKSKYLLVAIAVLSLAVPAFARPSKYKDWPNSPEGYFMTKAERDQWSKLDSDTDAEKFIADFVAKRPANFEKEVAERAANADKYLTIGKTAGSKSLRGKIIILFGVPTSMDQSDQAIKDQVHRDSPSMAGLMSNASGEGGGGGKGNGDDVGNIGDSLASRKVVRNLHFNYQGDIARTLNRKQVDITVQIDPNTGKDGINSRSVENEVNGMFETIAESWIKK